VTAAEKTYSYFPLGKDDDMPMQLVISASVLVCVIAGVLLAGCGDSGI